MHEVALPVVAQAERKAPVHLLDFLVGHHGQLTALDPGSGMIFVWDSVRGPDAAFYMWRTRMPLDIAFMDGAGVVRRILAMEPCPSLYVEACPTYPPGVEYRSALEVNRGWFAEHGLGVGSKITLPENLPSPPSRLLRNLADWMRCVQ